MPRQRWKLDIRASTCEVIFLINIKKLKFNFAKRYPQTLLTSILKQTPDIMTAEEFLASVAAWLVIIGEEALEVPLA